MSTNEAIGPSAGTGERRPGTRTKSRRQPLDEPTAFASGVPQPVVQPAGPPLPELEDRGDDAVSAPVLGAGNLAVVILQLEDTNAGFQDLAIGNHLALARGPSAQPGAGRPALEVGVGFLDPDPRDRPFEPNLPLQIVPVENQRRVRVGLELAALAALVVREEDKASLVIPAQQDNPRRGTAGRRRGGQDHGIGLGNRAECRCLEPAVELADRVGIKLPLGQAQAVVVLPRLVNAQDRRSRSSPESDPSCSSAIMAYGWASSRGSPRSSSPATCDSWPSRGLPWHRRHAASHRAGFPGTSRRGWGRSCALG